MLINLNKSPLDKSEEEKYNDYINKRENFNFLSRTITIDNNNKNNFENNDPYINDERQYKYNIQSENRRVTPKKKLKLTYK